MGLPVFHWLRASRSSTNLYEANQPIEETNIMYPSCQEFTWLFSTTSYIVKIGCSYGYTHIILASKTRSRLTCAHHSTVLYTPIRKVFVKRQSLWQSRRGNNGTRTTFTVQIIHKILYQCGSISRPSLIWMVCCACRIPLLSPAAWPLSKSVDKPVESNSDDRLPNGLDKGKTKREALEPIEKGRKGCGLTGWSPCGCWLLDYCP